MLYIDEKYINLISSRLRNFKRKDDHLYEFSCPLCGDSAKNIRKARGYFYPVKNKNRLSYKCHNCGRSRSVGAILEIVDPVAYREYVVEKYKEKEQPNPIVFIPRETIIDPPILDDNLAKLEKIIRLRSSHPAVKYVEDRKIPKDKWHRLFFCLKYKEWANSISPGTYEPVYDDHPRLVIPYFTEHGKMFTAQARAFGDEEPKYYFLKVDEDREKIYGLDVVDWNKKIYVVEGPIDSLFLDNAIAVSGASNFDSDSIQKIKTNAVLIVDREPRNKEIVKTTLKYIREGYAVCLLPEHVGFKDINEAILNGYTKESLQNLIDENTVSGLEAELKFNDWKKVELKPNRRLYAGTKL